MQGLFLKRQDEVSTLFGKLAADKYLVRGVEPGAQGAGSRAIRRRA